MLKGAKIETGASDYIVKPFSATELTARVRAALRRQVEPEPFALGELAITYEQRHVTLAGQPVPLTGTEYELLRVLSLNAGRVCEYDSLIRQVWGEANSGSRTLVRAFMEESPPKARGERRPADLHHDGEGSRLPHADTGPTPGIPSARNGRVALPHQSADFNLRLPDSPSRARLNGWEGWQAPLLEVLKVGERLLHHLIEFQLCPIDEDNPQTDNVEASTEPSSRMIRLAWPLSGVPYSGLR